ncbi:hypothetical protein RI129_004787 [Pyrocoelia pectoralis]|uniref:Uncharacterized protein n=1 Tax=Pyrocoelia pectoralis TaxID=417401 RepID=A0AAN7VJJ3_9COLE
MCKNVDNLTTTDLICLAYRYKGVQSRVMQMNELAKFCTIAHSLNVMSCTEAVSLFGLVQKLYCLFVGCTTRWKIIQKWSAKHQTLLNNLPKVVKALEEIEESSLVAESKYETGHLLHAVMDFKLILNLIIWDNILQEINNVNVE